MNSLRSYTNPINENRKRKIEKIIKLNENKAKKIKDLDVANKLIKLSQSAKDRGIEFDLSFKSKTIDNS
jgi:hypothetical protein